MRSLPRLWASIVAAMVLAGCAVGPDYERPDLLLPEEWPDEIAGHMAAGYDDVAFWWELYQDPVLDQLIDEALENNLDIGEAAARVARSRAVLGYRSAERYPVLGGLAEYQRDDPGLISDTYRTEMTVAAVLEYEVDLWGRLSRARESAKAALLGTAYTRDAVRLAVISDVVSTYFDYRAAREQIETTEATIVSFEEALELERSRRDRGATTELTVLQATAELENSRAVLPALKALAEQRRRALAVLIGDSEAVLDGLGLLGDRELEDLPDAMTDLPRSIPSDLLVRRPDVRAAEAFLIAANADIGAARAEWFPSVNLVGAYGTGARTTGGLFTGPAALWEIVAGAAIPILDFGRRRAVVSEAEAFREIAEIQYRAVVQEAFREVGDAWTLLQASEERASAGAREVEARDEVLRLAERRYLGGYIRYFEVLDARRALFDANLTMIDIARDRLVAAATLFRALGGGWQPGEAPASEDEE